MKPALNITKLDAAKRQLESAILLYFNYCDPISIHTLVAASYNVLRDLNEKRKGELMLKDCWQFLDDKEAKTFRRQVNGAENFFKHADKDPNGAYKFDPQWSEVLLMEASRKYLQLTQEQPPYLNMFLIWFVVNHQNMFKKIPELARVLAAAKLNAFPQDRRQFFVTFLPFATRLVGA